MTEVIRDQEYRLPDPGRWHCRGQPDRPGAHRKRHIRIHARGANFFEASSRMPRSRTAGVLDLASSRSSNLSGGNASPAGAEPGATLAALEDGSRVPGVRALGRRSAAWLALAGRSLVDGTGIEVEQPLMCRILELRTKTTSNGSGRRQSPSRTTRLRRAASTPADAPSPASRRDQSHVSIGDDDSFSPDRSAGSPTH